MRLEALANLAHELRTPVQTLLGYIDILRDELNESLHISHKRILNRMNANAHELAQTVENVMDFALSDAGAHTAESEAIRIHDLLAEVIPGIEAANEAKGLDIRFDLDSAPASFRAQRRPIKAILLNLAINAIKFTDRGSITIAFRNARSAGIGPALEMEIRDTGPGIKADLLAEAFERCSQLSNASDRRYRGMGLGLAVVQRNANRLGAKLVVRTNLGKGSSFRLLIPPAPPTVTGDCQGSKNTVSSGSGASSRPRHRESQYRLRRP